MSEWLKDDVTVDGITLHYYRTGGDKPPVLLAHGLTDNGLCWTPVVQALAQDYDCILVDARGHGHSAIPDVGYSNAEHAADYAGLIRALNLQQPVMIGHSMGADTSALLAAQYPKLVRAIVLEDPPWRPQSEVTTPEQRYALAEAWRARAVAQSALPLAELIEQGQQERPTWSAAELKAWATAKQQVSPNALNYVSESSTPWWAFVAKITCPTLLITADVALGAIVSAETAQTVSALATHLQVAHVAGAGHSIRREQFEPYVRVVRAFLAEVIR
ncbi:alpha/beta hydrolase [soil metagenome]